MANATYGPAAILRRVGIAAAGLAVVTAIGVNMYTRKDTPTGVSATRNIDCWGTSSGGQVGCIRENGAVAFSGSTTVNDDTTGSGRLKIAGSDGGGVVVNDADGSGCWAIEVNNGTIVTHGVPAGECP